MKLENERLFLKYAIPCSRVLVKRGWVKQDVIDDIVQDVIHNMPVKHNIQNIFQFAYSMCSFLAKRAGKEIIDSETIRKYFLKEHDEIMQERARQFRDIDTEECKVRTGYVVSVDGNKVTVRVDGKEKRCKNLYNEEIRPGDNVVIHYDIIIEKNSSI